MKSLISRIYATLKTTIHSEGVEYSTVSLLNVVFGCSCSLNSLTCSVSENLLFSVAIFSLLQRFNFKSWTMIIITIYSLTALLYPPGPHKKAYWWISLNVCSSCRRQQQEAAADMRGVTNCRLSSSPVSYLQTPQVSGMKNELKTAWLQYVCHFTRDSGHCTAVT